MAGHCVQQLGEDCGIEIASALLDHPKSEMDVAEESAFVRLAKCRAGTELADPAGVVDERSGKDNVVTQPRMQLCRLPAERRYANRVLEEAARVSVVAVRGRQEGSGGPSERRRRERTSRRLSQGPRARSRTRGTRRSRRARRIRRKGGEQGRIGVLRSLDRAHLNLEPPAEALDATEDAHGVALVEALVEQVDVVPDSCFHTSARVNQLEREVRRASAGTPPLLPRYREHALDGPVLDELGDRGHV